MREYIIRLGLVGFANRMMYKLADSFKKKETVEVSFIADSKETRGRAGASKYSTNYVSNINEAIEDYNINALCIGSEVEARKENLNYAIQNKNAILCLNPIAETPEDIKDILSVVRKRDIKFYAPFQLRYYMRFRQIREKMIKEGRKLSSLHCTVRYKSNENENILTNIGIHVLDLIRWFTRLEIDQVYAEAGGKTRRINQTNNVLMLMKLNSGAFASAELSYSFEEELYLNATYDDLFLQIKPLKQSVFIKGPSTSQRYLFNIDPSEYMVEEFINYLSRDETPSTTLDDVYKSSLLLSSAIKSLGKVPITLAR